ncbi:MAG: hypothetical protein ABF802_09835 [Acetobacter orientalis]
MLEQKNPNVILKKLTQPALRPTGRLLAVMFYQNQRATVGGVKKQAHL